MPPPLLPLSSLVSRYQLAPISLFLRCGRSSLSISLSCRGFWVLEADHLPISSLHGLLPVASTSLLPSPCLPLARFHPPPWASMLLSPPMTLLLLLPSRFSSSLSTLFRPILAELQCRPLSFLLSVCWLLHPLHHPSPLPWPSSPLATSPVFSIPSLARCCRHDQTVAFLLFDVVSAFLATGDSNPVAKLHGKPLSLNSCCWLW